MLEFLVAFNIFWFILFLVKWRKNNNQNAIVSEFQQNLLSSLQKAELNQEHILMIKYLNTSLKNAQILPNIKNMGARAYLEEYSKMAFEVVETKCQFHLSYFFDIFVLAYLTYLEQVNPDEFNRLLEPNHSFILKK